jgi:choline dehydrogenase-like flavoprotein
MNASHRSRSCDTLVIGSGFGGAAVARRLAEAGHRVLLVEKGPAIDPGRDFRQTQDPAYFRRYLKSVGNDALNLTYAEGLGGGSAFYEMVSLRAPSRAFEQVDESGRRLWPTGLDRSVLDPWYALAERELHVEQIAPEDVPPTGRVFAHLLSQLGYSSERAPYAVQGCVGSGWCVAGCIYGAKQSLLLNYLPAAREAGAEILTGFQASRIRPLEPAGYEVTLEPAGDDEASGLVVRARLVVLAGGTVGSARLLLRSRPWLRHLSPQVGRNLAWNGGVKIAGLLPDDCPDGDMYRGRSHPGVVSYEFLASHGVMVTAAKALPLQVVAGARFSLPGEAPGARRFGAGHVDLMKRFRHRALVLVAFGLTPPRGRLELDDEGRPRLVLELDTAIRTYERRVRGLLTSILERSGCRPFDLEWVNGEGRPYPDLHFSSTHHVGSCRMADSPRRGVVDVFGEVFGHPGLFVADGASIPSSLAVNSSLTILANAERIAHGILDRRPALTLEGASR